MSENLRYWLWLQKALGEGAYLSRIVDEFGSAKALYDANILEWRMSPNLTARQIDRLGETDIHSVDEIIYTCKSNNWQIIDYDDNRYPKRLKEIINPPAVLYVDGVLPDIDNLATVGVVGTRKASDYAIKVTHIMSRGATDAGLLIVSGGALGVDTAAHKGALMAGGKTIAVLGCGLGTSYLNENKSLRDTIKHNGALVTEYPPFTRASRTTFPMRNRIISGLSVGVLVVEAGVKSGSLITATKPIHLAAPYAEKFDTVDLSKVKSVEHYMNAASDKGANIPKANEPVFDAALKDRDKRIKNEKQASKLTGNADVVYQCLNESFAHIDIITEKTGLTVSQVMAALTQLEIMGLTESTSGKRYKRI